MDKLFLDANILFTAAYSESGASRALFELAKKKKLLLVSSKYAITEARHNIQKKLTEKHLIGLFRLIAELEIVDDAKFSTEEIQKYEKIIIKKDVPILLAAKNQKVQFLITLDKKDFKNTKIKSTKLPFAIMSPGEYLQSL
ncbi:PIN domain-containing protein [Candidatus Peregrinibacteria bacterium]|nr:PIN domain-containing protein [Candidatus Peregrinibacteria bacterium]